MINRGLDWEGLTASELQKLKGMVDKQKTRRRKIFFPRGDLSSKHTQRVNTVTRSSGDWPSWLRSVGSAPCARSSAHNWVLPFCAASCKGVNAHLSVALTHALYLMSKAATSTCCNETHGVVVLSGWCLFHFLENVAAWIWLCVAAKQHWTFSLSQWVIMKYDNPPPKKNPSCHSKPVWMSFFDSSVWWCHVWSTNESREDCQWNFL